MHRNDTDSNAGSLPGLLVLLAVTAVFVWMLTMNIGRAATLSAKEIMVKNEDARKISDVNSSATLTIGKGSAEAGTDTKTKKFTWWRKLTSDGTHFNTLTRFHEPAEIRGEGILFLEREGDQNDVQMYLPAYKKIRRVESQAQSGSFMGSEFSYADIATPHVDDYKYDLVKEEGGHYVVQSSPATDAVKERTGYSKTVQWIRKDNFMAEKGEYFDKDGALWKKTAAKDILEVDKTKHKWMAHDVRIENAKNGKYTTLRFSGVKVNQGVADSTFSQQNLAREK
jgi:outer membrane lipoprotein-sorting protein